MCVCVSVLNEKELEREAGISVAGHEARAKGPEAGKPLECTGRPPASS